MRASIKATSDIEDFDFEIAISMPLREWRVVMGQLQNDYPSWRLGSRPASISVRTRAMTPNPWCLKSRLPATLERMTSPTVAKAPISRPTTTKPAISRSGSRSRNSGMNEMRKS